jgi:hypothetical protein
VSCTSTEASACSSWSGSFSIGFGTLLASRVGSQATACIIQLDRTGVFPLIDYGGTDLYSGSRAVFGSACSGGLSSMSQGADPPRHSSNLFQDLQRFATEIQPTTSRALPACRMRCVTGSASVAADQFPLVGCEAGVLVRLM